eukprot:9038254-Alexandrium_andersonii.AAC.1
MRVTRAPQDERSLDISLDYVFAGTMPSFFSAKCPIYCQCAHDATLCATHVCPCPQSRGACVWLGGRA